MFSNQVAVPGLVGPVTMENNARQPGEPLGSAGCRHPGLPLRFSPIAVPAATRRGCWLGRGPGAGAGSRRAGGCGAAAAAARCVHALQSTAKGAAAPLSPAGRAETKGSPAPRGSGRGRREMEREGKPSALPSPRSAGCRAPAAGPPGQGEVSALLAPEIVAWGTRTERGAEEGHTLTCRAGRLPPPRWVASEAPAHGSGLCARLVCSWSENKRAFSSTGHHNTAFLYPEHPGDSCLLQFFLYLCLSDSKNQ